MGCNCGGQSTAKETYSYTDKNGQTTTGLSEMQARAAQIRAGGAGVVKKTSG